ncbi:MAG: hypothetical protein EOO03_07150 [Chitinophagaceae bacterium]|nr:MAG: hypothetical protein EOO03_07150 [Chitinophagaceae bacterium]
MQKTEKIILGTAQLGLHYGINNQTGKPGASEINKILDLARENGITLLDTAEAYGDALHAIANYHKEANAAFEIISKFKISGLSDLEKNVTHTNQRLGIESLYAYLLHDADEVLNPVVAEKFEILKAQQLIRHSGVSVYTNEQFSKAINASFIDVIQLPYNLLDNDVHRGELIALAKSKGKIIHTRSVFLQGLFFINAGSLPAKLQPLSNSLTIINTLCVKYGLQKVGVALQYVLGNTQIDGVLVGVESAAQLQDNIAAIGSGLPGEVIDEIIIATSENISDDVIAAEAARLKVRCSRGSEMDVLARYHKAAKESGADVIVRVTSDCPFVDPTLIDEMLRLFHASAYDYVSNTLTYTYPDGIDVEIFTMAALEQAFSRAALPSEREHVTPYIRKHSDQQGENVFKAFNFCNPEPIQEITRLTLDEPADLQLLTQLVEQLGTGEPWRTYHDHLMEHPEIKQINAYISLNEGYHKSLKQDGTD